MNKSRLFGSIAAITLIAIGAYAGYLKYGTQVLSDQNQASLVSDREILSYVPADTLMFFGGLETASWQEIIGMMLSEADWLHDAGWVQQLGAEQQAQLPPAVLMLSSMLGSYAQSLKNSTADAAPLGWGQQVDAALYTVGFLPVLRIKLADAPAFIKYINDAQQQVDLTPELSAAGDISIRAYSLDKPTAEEPSDTNLLIGTSSRYAIITLGGKLLGGDIRDSVFGLKKPASSLAHVSTLQDIKEKYHFHPAYIGYLSHREIMNGLTGDVDSGLSRMLDTLFAQLAEARATAMEGISTEESQNPADLAPDDTQESRPTTPGDTGMANTETTTEQKHPLAALRTAACRSELMLLAELWPQTVFGYTKLELTGNPKIMETRTVVENTDPAFMKSMQQLRGFVPAFVKNSAQKPMFGVALGLNVDALAPFITATVQSFISKQYQCAFLADLKTQLTQNNPALMLGMVSGMIAGVQGFSAMIMDLDADLIPGVEAAAPEIRNIDALLTLTSTNPQSLVALANGMNPDMPPIQLPADGSAVNFPLPLPIALGKPLKLALKGNHLVAFTGEISSRLANDLATTASSANGFLALNMDYGRYMKMLLKFSDQMTAENSDPPDTNGEDKSQALAAMEKLKMQMMETVDIETGGLVMDINVTMD